MKLFKPLILFSGPDGSGKTSIANALREILQEHGYEVKIVRIRGTHTIAFIVMLILRHLCGLHGKELHYFNIIIPRGLKKFWVYLEIISVFPHILFWYILGRLRYIVISERSLLDLAIWILTGLDMNKHEIVKTLAFKWLMMLILKYKPFYITADREELEKRKPYDVYLIRNMLPYYDLLSKTLHLETVKTSTYDFSNCLKFFLNQLFSCNTNKQK
jgi:energy-coupling factor transporter ATP-binding protein EcfA2